MEPTNITLQRRTLGGMLRLVEETARAQVYARMIALGFADIRPAHSSLFRNIAANGSRVSDLADRAQMTKQSMGYLADSLAAHRPVLLLLSTPRYCQTAICGPVLDLLVDAMSTRTDVDVIHNEVYANPDAVASLDQATPAPLVEAYSMVFEPCLFVVAAGGTLVRRLDTIYDRTELRAAISALS